MRTETVTVRIGEDVGPVDWTHPTSKDMPPIWREAEQNPSAFVFGEYSRPILRICMYDGWPYWEPRPAIQYIGPLKSAEWAFFNSYMVRPDSIAPHPPNCANCGQRPFQEAIWWQCACSNYRRAKPSACEAAQVESPAPGGTR
jgi:hypothetical protein